MITAALLDAIVSGYPLSLAGVHGLHHWARVFENGRLLAAQTGADVRVVELFAVFHDARRQNESIDPGHGSRGAELARALRGVVFDLDDAAFALLLDACERHTDGEIDGEVTVRTCWDADRLDLNRVAITPDPDRLATAAARDPALLAWADARARERTVPDLVPTVWLPLLEGGDGGRHGR